jgi:hypothetical protein
VAEEYDSCPTIPSLSSACSKSGRSPNVYYHCRAKFRSSSTSPKKRKVCCVSFLDQGDSLRQTQTRDPRRMLQVVIDRKRIFLFRPKTNIRKKMLPNIRLITNIRHKAVNIAKMSVCTRKTKLKCLISHNTRG